MSYAEFSTSSNLYAQVRVSNSNNGYTVLNGLGCNEVRIAVGELAKVLAACAGSTMMQRRTRTVCMILPVSMREHCFASILLGWWVMTEGDDLGFSLCVGGVPAVGLRLVLDPVLLADLSSKITLVFSCLAGLVCETALLTNLAV